MTPTGALGAADESLAHWLTHFPEDELALQSAQRRGDDEVLDAFFSRSIPFGTGGRRGPVGPGTGGINPLTVSRTVRAHARWLRARGHGKPCVVIGWDTRSFHDLRDLWRGEVPPSVKGLTSRDLAIWAASAYLEEGVEVYWPVETALPYVSTPQLSFFIRELGAHGGVMLSASHNPPDDNGVKIYGAHGGQLLPPHDDTLAMGEAADALPRKAVVASFSAIPKVLIDQYLEVVASGHPPAPKRSRVLYSPLHGCGRWSVLPALEKAGVDVVVDRPTATPDGSFPEVADRQPNPERAAVYEGALCARAEEAGATLLLCTDPDADRVGLAVYESGEWTILNGDELAALILWSRLQVGVGLLLTTEVTTPLLGRMARAAGCVVEDWHPVGFKYLAGALRRMQGEGQELVMAAEESHGVLLHEQMGDKDAAGAAVAAVKAAELAVEAHGSLSGWTEWVGRHHGFVVTEKRALGWSGPAGAERMTTALERLAAGQLRRLGHHEVVRVADRRAELPPLGPVISESHRRGRTQFVVELSIGRLIVRPSGTEPKFKLYSVGVSEGSMEEARRRAGEILDGFQDWERSAS